MCHSILYILIEQITSRFKIIHVLCFSLVPVTEVILCLLASCRFYHSICLILCEVLHVTCQKVCHNINAVFVTHTHTHTHTHCILAHSFWYNHSLKCCLMLVFILWYSWLIIVCVQTCTCSSNAHRVSNIQAKRFTKFSCVKKFIYVVLFLLSLIS